MMILRAAFFIGLVLILAPHEPDLGLGRPGAAGAGSLSPAAILAGLPQLGQVCASCGRVPASLPRLQIQGAPFETGRSLADVKAEIQTAIAARRTERY